MAGSIFLDVSLPNAATWFYLSLLLAVALFFKFSRLLSVRNWDVLTLFLLVPGLLLLRPEAQTAPAAAEPDGNGAQTPRAEAAAPTAKDNRVTWLAYLWLICGSAYFMARCLVDLALVRRPALSPNMNLAGLAWLGGALFVCLAVVAVRGPAPRPEMVAKAGQPALTRVQEGAVGVVNQETGAAAAGVDTRFWVGCTLAMICHLAVVALLVLIAWRHFQDIHAGMAAGTFYLLLPYTALSVGEWQYVLPVAFMLGAVLAYRKPTISGLLLGLATGTGYFPAVTFPVWLSFYWRRGAGRFASAFSLALGMSLAVSGLILWWDGELSRSVQNALERSDWQPWKVAMMAEGFWTGVHWAYRMPVFIAYAAFLLALFFWPAPKNLAHVLALSAAVLLGIQFWFAYHGGVYVLWYLPLLLLVVFRPNLSDRLPLIIVSETDWLARLGRKLVRSGKRFLRLPQPLAPVR